MTEKEYYKWCKKFRKKLKKKCNGCGGYGIVCERCRNVAQIIEDRMKKEVLENE